jgi:hypothetical protein
MTRTLRRSLWVVVALATAPMPAAAADICDALTRIAASARETPAFGSVQRALANGEAVVPGFGPQSCHASATGVECGMIGMAARWEQTDWPAAVSCPGFTPMDPAAIGARPGMRGRDSRRSYAGPGVLVSFGLDCGPCRGPASSFFSVTIDTRTRRPEE